jgi:hypothetical protein
MAHLSKKPSKHEGTNSLLETLGYKIANSCSEFSCWRREDSSSALTYEIFIPRDLLINNIEGFTEFIYREGMKTGKRMALRKVKEDAARYIGDFWDKYFEKNS